jgi:hypothetical protein
LSSHRRQRIRAISETTTVPPDQESTTGEATTASQEQEEVTNGVTSPSQKTKRFLLADYFPPNTTVHVPSELERMFNITWKVPPDLHELLQRSNFPHCLGSFSAFVAEAEQLYPCSSSEEEDVIRTELKKWHGIEGMLMLELVKTFKEYRGMYWDNLRKSEKELSEKIEAEVPGYSQVDAKGNSKLWDIMNAQPEIVDIRTKLYSQCCVLLYVSDKVRMTDNNYSRLHREKGRHEAESQTIRTVLLARLGYDEFQISEEDQNLKWFIAHKILKISVANIAKKIKDKYTTQGAAEQRVRRGIAAGEKKLTEMGCNTNLLPTDFQQQGEYRS